MGFDIASPGHRRNYCAVRTALRWALVLPAAVGAAAGFYVLGYLFSSNDWWNVRIGLVMSWTWSSMLFVMAGAAVAPSNQCESGVVLAVVWSVAAAFYTGIMWSSMGFPESYWGLAAIGSSIAASTVAAVINWTERRTPVDAKKTNTPDVSFGNN